MNVKVKNVTMTYDISFNEDDVNSAWAAFLCRLRQFTKKVTSMDCEYYVSLLSIGRQLL